MRPECQALSAFLAIVVDVVSGETMRHKVHMRELIDLQLVCVAVEDTTITQNNLAFGIDRLKRRD